MPLGSLSTTGGCRQVGGLPLHAVVDKIAGIHQRPCANHHRLPCASIIRVVRLCADERNRRKQVVLAAVLKALHPGGWAAGYEGTRISLKLQRDLESGGTKQVFHVTLVRELASGPPKDTSFRPTWGQEAVGIDYNSISPRPVNAPPDSAKRATGL